MGCAVNPSPTARYATWVCGPSVKPFKLASMPAPPTQSATLGQLLAKSPKAELAVSCLKKLWLGGFEQHKLKQAWGKRLSCAELADVYGREITVAQIGRKLVCRICGARVPDVLVEVVMPDGKPPGARHG